MENNEIVLEFEKTITNLAGNRMGNQIYMDKVEPKLDMKKVNIVVFPVIIEDIASSFIEGMYKKLGETYGKNEAIKIMVLKAQNEEANEKIKESIDTFGV